MLESLKLKCFMQHEDREFNFTGQMNCIKGENEAGKSTLYHAIKFAFWGTRALPLGIEDTVTWGHKATELRVELVFTHGPARYEIYRTKGSAELNGNGLKVSGHAAVTDFISSLFKANLSVANKVLVANQVEVRSTIEGGSSKLIEDLSGMDLIDLLVQKMQAHKSTGSTKDHDLQLVALDKLLETRPSNDTTAEDDAVAVAQNALSEAENAVAAARSAVDALADPAEKAVAALAVYRAATSRRDSLTGLIAGAQRILATPMPPEPVDLTPLIEAKAAQQAQVAAKQRWEAFRVIKLLPAEGTFEDYEQLQKEGPGKLQDLYIGLAAAQTELSSYTHEMQHTGVCHECGTHLEDPAVIQGIVDRAKEGHAKYTEIVAEIKQQIEQLNGTHAAIKAIEVKNRAQEKALQPYANWLMRDDTQWPPQFLWVGQSEFEVDPRDYSKEITEANERNKTYEVIKQNHDLARVDRDRWQAELNEDVSACDVTACETVIQAHKDDKQRLQDADKLRDQCMSAVAQADTNLQLRLQAIAAAEAEYDRNLIRRADLKLMIAGMVMNNGIIKKLRESRTPVANKLWALVLHVVTDYFSGIRGVQSVVTKNADGFLIDGKPVAAFSGSTIDSLSLAVRFALQKIFLGELDFILLDEPASGMAASREQNLLGEIVRCGIPQTLVVTHSNLADAFANNLIEV